MLSWASDRGLRSTCTEEDLVICEVGLGLGGWLVARVAGGCLSLDQVSRLRVFSSVSFDEAEIELKSLILAQIERWRHALHMQVERQRGATWRRAANG